jgi:hypothetical protein
MKEIGTMQTFNKLFGFLLSMMLLSFSELYPQIYRSAMFDNALQKPYGFSFASLNSHGYASAVHNFESDMGVSNPASLIENGQVAVGISYRFDSRINEKRVLNLDYADYHFNFQYYRVLPALPQSIILVIPVKLFRLGLGYNQIYNSGTDYGRISVITTSFIPVAEVRPCTEMIVHTYSLSFAYSLPQLKTLKFGVRYNYYRLYHRATVKDVKVLDDSEIYTPYDSRQDGNGAGVTLGMIYHFTRLKLGAFYDSGVNFEDEMIRGSFPRRVAFGFVIDYFRQFSIQGNINYIFWDKMKYHTGHIFNQPEYSCNIMFNVSDKLKPSVGFFSTDHRLKNANEMTDRNQAVFFTGGLNYTFKQITIDAVVADSHWLSDEFRKQTIVKIGMAYHF